MSRTYTQDEVREIIRRAAETTVQRQRAESDNSGLSLEELKDLAIATGLDPEVMLDAARSMDREVEDAFEKRILGIKISAAHAIRVDGPFTDEDWQALVSDCRITFEAKGKVHDEAGFREWSNGNLHVVVEPTGADSIIRMRTHKGQAQSMLGAGAAFALAFLATILAAFAQSGAPQDLLLKMLILSSAVIGAGAFGITRVRNWSQTRESQMEALGRRIEQRRRNVGKATTSAPVLTPAEDVRGPQIEIPEPETDQSSRADRAERRERE